MPALPDPDSLVEELKRVHLGSYICLDAFIATLHSLNIDCYEWKVKENYNGVPMCFSVNQLPPSITNSTETDFKKRASLKQNEGVHNDATSS